MKRSKYFDPTYNRQVIILDELYEFHIEAFLDLDSSERRLLEDYYLIGVDVPEDIFKYRSELLAGDPSIQGEAERVGDAVCKRLSIQNFLSAEGTRKA